MAVPIKMTCSWILKAILNQRVKTQETQVWKKADSNKKFPTKNMYHASEECHQEPIWRKLCYGNMATPRAQFVLWIACHEKLTTRERMHKFRLIANDKCCFFYSVETLKHIFFECTTLDKIYKEVLCWLQIDRSPED